MTVVVLTTGLAASAVFCSVAVAAIFIIILILCGDKNKSDDNEPQLVQQAALPEDSAKPVAPSEVIIEVETGEVTKRPSNGSAPGGDGRNSSANQRSSQECNGSVEQSQAANRKSNISAHVNTSVVPYEDDNEAEDDNEGEDDYDHIQRKTFQPKTSNENTYNKINLASKGHVVEVGSETYSQVGLADQKTGGATGGGGDDYDEDYAIVDSPTRDDGVAFTGYPATASSPAQNEKEASPVYEDEDYDGNYAVVDKNKMSDEKSKATRQEVQQEEEEEETYAVITPPPVPEKNFDFGDAGPANSGSPPQSNAASSLLPTAGSLPPMIPVDPEPPYSSVTARESLASINQRRTTSPSAAVSQIVEEDYYSTVAGESGNGTISRSANRISTSSDLYDEIKGGPSGDDTVAPPPVDVDHLKRITNSAKIDNEAANNIVDPEPGHLYAQVNKPQKKGSDSNSTPLAPSYPDTGYDNVEIRRRSQLASLRRGYEEVDLHKGEVTKVTVSVDETFPEDENDPNYDTVTEGTVGGASAPVNGAVAGDLPSGDTQGDLVTRIQVGGADNATVLSHAKRVHQYEDVDKTKDPHSTIHCDMVTKI